ncbi:hypothetical protein [Bradyrhizobium genosp. A]|uniref:hypothetical protein n=1 Tax=Bradyrhizobium genosp. A TaxID=83626 RepID=UPI003CE69A19
MGVPAGTAGTTVVITPPVGGDTLMVGTGAAELTPRLPISVEPNGILAPAMPPGVVGEVDVGVDEAATLPEPEPHIPDIPEVSSVPVAIEPPELADIPDVGIPGAGAVAGVAPPPDIPPPS